MASMGWLEPATQQDLSVGDADIAPEGQKWVCCVACQGSGKVLVPVETERTGTPAPNVIPRPQSAISLSSDGIKRYQVHVCVTDSLS
jgi:hypothetical protein